MNPLAIFGVCTVAVVVAGVYLEKYGEIIAEKIGMSKGFVGLLLLAFVTSLPELVTSATASAQGNVDIAMGNVFGSNMFNLMILALCDVFSKQGPILALIGMENCMSGGLGIILMGIPLFGMLVVFLQGSAGASVIAIPQLWNVGLDSVLIVGVYVIGLWMIYKNEIPAAGGDEEFPDISLAKAVVLFVVCSAAIVTAGYYLAGAADEISKMKIGGVALGQSFVGSLLVAFATSLPEVVICLAAVFRNSFDVAVGNILGSNMFNMLIIFVADLFSRGKLAISSASPLNMIPGIAAVIMSAVVVVGLVQRVRHKDKPGFVVARIGVESIVLIIIYMTTIYLLFNLRDLSF